MVRTKSLVWLSSFGMKLSYLTLFGAACSQVTEDSSETTIPAPAPVQMAEPLPDHEPTPQASVIVRWKDMALANGTPLPSSSRIAGELRNATDRTVSGRLMLVTAGLDGRKIERELQRFSLAGKRTMDASIEVIQLPVQSEVAPSFAALVAEMESPSGMTKVSSRPLYYRFQKGYAEAVLFGSNELTKEPDWGLRTDKPTEVQGRILEIDGQFTDAAELGRGAAEAAVSSGSGRQGLSTIVHTAVDVRTGKAVLPPPRNPPKLTAAAPPRSAAAHSPAFVVCSNWWVQYTDSDKGEDYFATSSWAHQRARYAYAYLVDAWWNVIWEGNLDSAGCASVEVPAAGEYGLFQITLGTHRDGREFNTFYHDNGSFLVGADLAWFTVYPNTTWMNLYPWGVDDSIQVAAITGQVLYQDFLASNGLGLLANHPYRIDTNLGCPTFAPFTDSCYVRPSHGGGTFGTTRIGTTVIDGAPSANWKYVTAHEIGHHVQDAAMGFISYDYNETATQSLCTCSYDLSWGNVSHCLQSREHSGGGQTEGFAQTFAARVFNSPGDGDQTLVYYKPIAWDNWNDPTWPPSRVEVLDQYQWRHTNCPATDRGVEMDWMGFFAALTSEYSSDSVPMTDVFNVYRTTCGSGTSVKCNNSGVLWGNLDFWAGSYWASNPDAYNYWIAMANAYGVNN